jgi:hypothetical protein
MDVKASTRTLSQKTLTAGAAHFTNDPFNTYPYKKHPTRWNEEQKDPSSAMGY